MRRASHWLLAAMRIAVIGKGKIGGTLGSKWRAAGHDVVYGARDGSGEGPGGAPVRSIGDALKDADVVLLAVPGQAVPDVVSEQGAALAGKVVIDAVNRMGAPEFDSRALIADAAHRPLQARPCLPCHPAATSTSRAGQDPRRRAVRAGKRQQRTGQPRSSRCRTTAPPWRPAAPCARTALLRLGGSLRSWAPRLPSDQSRSPVTWPTSIRWPSGSRR